MIKLVLLLSRKPGMTPEEFKHYYETVHVAEACKRFPSFLKADYRRNYIAKTLDPGAAGIPIDFDAVTELTFASQADLDAHFTALQTPEAIAWVSQDLGKFTDLGKTRIYIVDERTSA